MYLVFSKWEVLPDKEEEFVRRSIPVREAIKSQPGVVFVEAIFDGKIATSVHAYNDEATYRAVVQDPNGPFARALAESKLEEVGRWVSSERGQAV